MIAQRWTRTLAGLCLCLLLSGCFFMPGQFESQLDLRKDGTFTFRYAGELVFAKTEQPAGNDQWSPSMARCYAQEDGSDRPCNEDEIENARAKFIAARALREAQAAEFAALTGYNPLDGEANRQIAAQMMRYPGWKQVEFKGNGVFQVEYAITGRLDRELVFPVLPQAQLSVPILIVRPGPDGMIEVEAPGMGGSQIRKVVVGALPKTDQDDLPLFKRTLGTLTISTDAAIISTNGVIARAGDQQTLRWQIAGTAPDMPVAQLKP